MTLATYRVPCDILTVTEASDTIKLHALIACVWPDLVVEKDAERSSISLTTSATTLSPALQSNAA